MRQIRTLQDGIDGEIPKTPESEIAEITHRKHNNRNKKEHFEFEAWINKESSTKEADNAPYREE